jgi:hypothetical protein
MNLKRVGGAGAEPPMVAEGHEEHGDTEFRCPHCGRGFGSTVKQEGKYMNTHVKKLETLLAAARAERDDEAETQYHSGFLDVFGDGFDEGRGNPRPAKDQDWTGDGSTNFPADVQCQSLDDTGLPCDPEHVKLFAAFLWGRYSKVWAGTGQHAADIFTKLSAWEKDGEAALHVTLRHPVSQSAQDKVIAAWQDFMEIDEGRLGFPVGCLVSFEVA